MSHSGGKLKSLMVISFLKFGSHGFLSVSSSPLIRRRQPESTQISQKRRRLLLTHFARHGGIVSLFIHLKIVALSQRRAAGSVSQRGDCKKKKEVKKGSSVALQWTDVISVSTQRWKHCRRHTGWRWRGGGAFRALSGTLERRGSV